MTKFWVIFLVSFASGNKAAIGNSKELVRLRKRKTPAGNTSLYLVIYINGDRLYEYLKLYLIPEKNRESKKTNQETLKLAEAIKSKRVIELRNGEYGFKSEYATDTLFFDYYRSMCEKRLGEESRGNWGNWFRCLHHLRKYEKREKITFAEITVLCMKRLAFRSTSLSSYNYF